MEKLTRDTSGHNHGKDGRFVTVTGTEQGRYRGGTITHIATPHGTAIGRVRSVGDEHVGSTHEGKKLSARASQDEAERDVERSYIHHAKRIAGRPKAVHDRIMGSYMEGYDPKREHGQTFPVKRWNMSAKRLDSMARTAFRLGQHYGNPAAESRMDAARSERVEHPHIDAIVARHVPDYARKRHHEIMPEQARAIVGEAWKHGVGQHKQEAPKKAASLFGGEMKKDTAPVAGNELVAQSLERKGKVVRRTAAGRRRGRLARRMETVKMNKGMEWLSREADKQRSDPRVPSSHEARQVCRGCGKPKTHANHGTKMTRSSHPFRKNFASVQRGIERKEGYSPKRAAAIAATIGRKKLGEKEMARRSAAGRRRKKADGSELEKRRARAVRCTECGERWGHGHRAGATGSSGTSWGGQCSKSKKNSGAHNIVFSRPRKKTDGHEMAMLKRAGESIPACECGWEGRHCMMKAYGRLQHRRHISTIGSLRKGTRFGAPRPPKPAKPHDPDAAAANATIAGIAASTGAIGVVSHLDPRTRGGSQDLIADTDRYISGIASHPAANTPHAVAGACRAAHHVAAAIVQHAPHIAQHVHSLLPHLMKRSPTVAKKGSG